VFPDSKHTEEERNPWFAILGAHKTLDHHLGIFAAIVSPFRGSPQSGLPPLKSGAGK
jgi:hypothetical protein